MTSASVSRKGSYQDYKLSVEDPASPTTFYSDKFEDLRFHVDHVRRCRCKLVNHPSFWFCERSQTRLPKPSRMIANEYIGERPLTSSWFPHGMITPNCSRPHNIETTAPKSDIALPNEDNLVPKSDICKLGDLTNKIEVTPKRVITLKNCQPLQSLSDSD